MIAQELNNNGWHQKKDKLPIVIDKNGIIENKDK